MAKFRKKPVVIEAVRWTGSNRDEVEAFIGGDALEGCPPTTFIAGDSVVCATLEGQMRGGPGDWIIRGVQGELYPCKDDIFQATYDPVPDAGAVT